MSEYVLFNVSAFTGPDPDSGAIQALLKQSGKGAFRGTISQVVDAFTTKVKYSENKRPWDEWLGELSAVLGKVDGAQWMVVAGQAPGGMYACLGAGLHHPARSVVFVNPRFNSVLPVSDVLREDKDEGDPEITKMQMTTYGSTDDPCDVFVAYIGTNPRNTFTDANVQAIRSAMQLPAGAEFCGAGINSTEQLRIDAAMLPLLYAEIKKLFIAAGAHAANTLVLSCSSMDAVCYIAASEAVRTRNTFESVYFAERLSNGAYHLIPLRV